VRVFLVILAFNEEANQQLVNPQIKVFILDFDYIVINDCSTDSTKKLLDILNTSYIDLSVNLDTGGGAQTCYRYALEHNCDIATQIDGDGRYDPYSNNNATFSYDFGIDRWSM